MSKSSKIVKENFSEVKKRVFVAIDFPWRLKDQIGEGLGKLSKQYPEIRWEKKENLHLTLKFLGWTEAVEEIGEGMEKAVRGIKPFWFCPAKPGYFLKESLIVWLGAESQEGLWKLVDNLEEEMAKIGFSKEKRPFTPHITLGRLRHAHPAVKWRKMAEELGHFPASPFEKFKVEQIVLMESHLSPGGSSYVILKTQGLPH